MNFIITLCIKLLAYFILVRFSTVQNYDIGLRVLVKILCIKFNQNLFMRI